MLVHRLAVLISVVFVVAGCASDGPETGADGSESQAVTTTTPSVDGATSTEPVDRPATVSGIPECRDLKPLEASVEGSLATGDNPDDAVIDVLIEYGEENPGTYAGYWIDRRHQGALVVAFTDDPAPRLEAILARSPGSSSLTLSQRDDVAIDVVQVEFSEADLASAVEKVAQTPLLSMTAVHARPLINRVAVDLFDPSPEDLETLAEVAPAAMTCVVITDPPSPPEGPLNILEKPELETMQHCDLVNLVLPFPASAIDDATPVEDSDHPSAIVMADFLAERGPVHQMPDFPFDSGQWIVLTTAEVPEPATGEIYSLFGNLEGGVIGSTAWTRLVVDHWDMSGWGLSCRLRLALPPGLSDVETFLDLTALPEPSSSTVNVLVRELSCPGGELTDERLRGPEIIETDTEVIVGFAAAKRYGSPQCEGSPMTSAVVELAEPLGDRTLIDGTRVPPAPIVVP